MNREIAAFVAEFAGRMHPLERQSALAWWNLAVTGKDEFRQESERVEAAFRALFTADPGEFTRLRAWHDQRAGIDDPVLRRQVEILYRTFLANQWTPEETAQVSALEAQLEQEYANFRGIFRGRPVNDNEILDLLKQESDSAARREAWEASKQIGAHAVGRVLDLVRLRNGAARRLGYPDFYHLSLDAQEIAPDDLRQTAETLADLTLEPFRQAKAELDARLAARWGVAPGEMGPWHYEDPFFQNVPAMGDSALDAALASRNVAELTAATFADMGLDVRAILARSDLYERDGKSQHAFATHIDRMTDDVRILCNVRPAARWMSTSLHECGHAVYDQYLGTDLPYLLRQPAHTNTTEAVAMLMGRLAYDARWQQQYLGIASAPDGAPAGEQLRTGQLIFVRWALVMIAFERDLYADPDRPDLNHLWWEYVERFQQVHLPEERDAPDWAAKLHLALAPVYYHNYLLGELTASQLKRAISQQAPGGHLAGSEETGQFLRERVFSQGALRPWNEALHHATDAPLTVDSFASEFHL